MKKRFRNILISITISLTIIITPCFAYADAGQLVVGGGSIPTGGLSGLDQLAYTVPIFGALLSAFGIGVNISEESQQAGMTKTEYIADQILRWKGNKTNAVNHAITEFLGGAQIDINGVIYLTDYALDLFMQFGNWVISNRGENFISTVVENPSYSVDGNIVARKLFAGDIVTSVRIGNENDISNEFISVTNDCMVTQYKYTSDGYYRLMFISDLPSQSCSYRYWYIPSSYNTYTADLNIFRGNYYFTYNISGQIGLTEWSGVPYLGEFSNVAALENYINNLGVWSGSGATDVPYDDYFEGNPSEWIDNLPSLDIPQGYTGAIDPGILADLEAGIAEGRDCVISIKDYLDAIGEAVNEDVADVSIPVTDTGTGTIADIPAVDFPADFPAYDPVADPDLPQEGEMEPVVDPVAPADPNEIIDSNLIDLKDLFPFCIPFDIARLLGKFAAEPEAPKFTIDYTFPLVDVNIKYEVDFSPFNNVASVLRTMELVAAVIGLAIATRAIYIRS